MSSTSSSANPENPNAASGNDKTTLWMGELEPWLDENAIRKIWAAFGESVSVKLIHDKYADVNAGYCFVDFGSHSAAAKALLLNGQPIPNTNRVFRLNWASGGGLTDPSVQANAPTKPGGGQQEYSIFVGDLAPEVTEQDLLDAFQAHYPSCKSVKIMIDPATNASRGYGFVRFTDESHMQRALVEMQGFMCKSRPVRISTATPKSSKHAHAHTQAAHAQFQQFHPNHNMYQGFYGQPINQFTDPNNTTVFVGGLSSMVTEDELRRYFQPFGEITYVKIPQGKGCGFVQFIQRHSAEAAITQMQGYPIGNSRVRLSWGRSQNAAANNNNPNMGPYRPAPPPPPPPPPHPHYGQLPPPPPPPHPPYGPYGPIDPQTAHMHPMPPPPQMPPPPHDPSEPVPVARLNELYLAARDGRLDRMEADSRGYHGVYAQ